MSTDLPAPEKASGVVRPEAIGSAIDGLMKHAPTLTHLWGGYRAFAAFITIAAIVGLVFVPTGSVFALVAIVLAALWSPLIAKCFGLLD